MLLIWGVFLAALFDAIENIALLNLLSGNLNQVWSSMAYYFAVLKFSILAIVMVYILINLGVLLIRKFRNE